MSHRIIVVFGLLIRLVAVVVPCELVIALLAYCQNMLSLSEYNESTNSRIVLILRSCVISIANLQSKILRLLISVAVHASLEEIIGGRSR